MRFVVPYLFCHVLHGFEHCIDVPFRGAVVKDAGSQQKPAAQRGARNERDPVRLHPLHYVLVQGIERFLIPCKFLWAVPEANDREFSFRP